MDIPEARRLERPAWLNARTISGVLIFALAFLGAQRAIDTQRRTVAAWSVVRDLPTGTVLTSGDLTLAQVVLPDGQLEHYALDAIDVTGSVLTAPLQAGELVPLRTVQSGGPAGAGRSMTIPVDVEHAVGGRLDPGDHIDVYATFGAQGGGARTVLLVANVEILDVVTAGGLVEEEAAVGLTVSVSPDDAAKLAFAVRTAVMDVVRVDDPSVASSGTTVKGEDLP